MNTSTDKHFAQRINNVPPSFIREILKVTQQSDIISFAGGLPYEKLFPIEQIKAASQRAFTHHGTQLLQYSNTEGDLQLRQWIAARYQRQNLSINAEDILITNGSQQALDLLGKVFINKGDAVVIENPGYLGALQAFQLYQAKFLTVSIDDNGMDISQLQHRLASNNSKLIYTVPNFQNPTGISYSEDNRRAVALEVAKTDSYLIQDDPYGELRFSGEEKSNFMSLLPQQTILLGSFSKTIAPALRLGWMVAPAAVMKKLIIAKQAADLHSSSLAQAILYQYLQDNNVEAHLERLCRYYGQQKIVMENAIKRYFPKSTQVTNPEGGLFLWCRLDKKVSTSALFKTSIQQKVAFVPGESFYTDNIEKNTMRLNYSGASPERIEKGIRILGNVITSY
ncbi:MAG: PLP-dependent aminotransferase family protein [Aquificaceae bacterium]|nr:MAG: PLP-dependent aminotransferase family protein [Aquificaceae bacterium]